jgi:hypothetical protein
MRNFILAALLSLIASTPACAALTVNVYEWETGSKTTFTGCEISFWHAEAYVDRDMNDGNYLYVDCADYDQGVPAPSEEPRYESRGISHDEIIVTAGEFSFEDYGCYVTEQTLGTGAESIRVECPTAVELRGSFESKD